MATLYVPNPPTRDPPSRAVKCQNKIERLVTIVRGSFNIENGQIAFRLRRCNLHFYQSKNALYNARFNPLKSLMYH